MKKYPDLVQGKVPTRPQQLWVADITYIAMNGGFSYLHLLTDAYSKKIVGYHLSQNLKAQSCIIGLNKAIASLSPTASVIHHSDRGIQYCCEAYVDLLQKNQIGISMTQSGSPYDNSVAERVNGILKQELILDQVFASYHEAVSKVHGAIDTYNRIRPHMSCTNLTPEKAHQSEGPLKKLWKPKRYRKAKSVSL